jgi:mannose-6-phosphate isomerase
MELLDSPIRPYAWGSRYAIAAVQGREIPTGGPEAELWLGAHPGAPSRLVSDGRGLADVVAADPARLLGPAERFGRLPFLMKLLAAEQPLSLQAHPDADQARAGYDAEQAAGVPLDAPHRNYADPYHKPEMLVALTDFDVLCGFRDPAVSAHVLDRLGVADLDPVVTALRSAGPGPATADALRTAVTQLLTLPDARRTAVVDEAVAAASTLCSRWSAVTGAPRAGTVGHGVAGGSGGVAAAGGGLAEDPAARSYALAVELGERYPGDAGVLVALLLNHLRLGPGDAVFAPAGYLHAYLRGVGVEIMAASDNVLRGGLTPKHVDVPELLKLLRFEAGLPPLLSAEDRGPGWRSWPSRVDEFALSHVRVGGPHAEVVLPATGPRLLLCLTGRLIADDGTGPVTLTPGHAAFVPADRPEVHVTGFGELYQATTAG